MMVAASLRLVLWLMELILLPSQKIWDGPGTAWDWLSIFGTGHCHAGMLSGCLFWLAAAGAVSALCWTTGVSDADHWLMLPFVVSLLFS